MRTWLKNALLFTVAAGAIHCGVKGDPVPPATPAEIGRGKPLFKGEEDESVSPVKKKYDPADKQDDQDQEKDED